MNPSEGSKAWIVAARIGVVEAMKDQGKWNHAIRSLNQHDKNNIRSLSHAKKLSSSPAMASNYNFRDEKTKQAEDSLRKVMYLSCWGPY